MKKLLIFALLSFALCGCFPAKFIKTPELDGKIVDIETQAPIPNAKIYFKRFEDNRVSSDVHGDFKLPKNEEWGTFILLGPFDPVPPHGILVIEAEGYETVEYEVGWGNGFDGKAQLKKKD